MLGFLNGKVLLVGVLLASPTVAAWALREGAAEPVSQAARSVATASGKPADRVPVEVFTKGSPPQWVYIEVEPQAIPEPGVLPLLGLPAMALLLRRRREK